MNTPTNILFLVTSGNAHVVNYSIDRESAKRTAWEWLRGDKDQYIVTPLTQPGDRVRLNITLSV